MYSEAVVVIGAGQGGFQVAASLRQEGFKGSITLIGDEPGLPYQRPPLSKAYLQGKLGPDQLHIRPGKWFIDQNVELIHDRVKAIDRGTRSVLLESGHVVEYGQLVLATGARNRRLDLAGSNLPEVIGIRSRANADELAPLLKKSKSVVVIGAGFIGLEFAAVASSVGLTVHVLEMGDRPMARAVSQPTSALFRSYHEDRGVLFHFGREPIEIVSSGGHVTGVKCKDGPWLQADLVVYGIGVLPNSELAAAAGLPVQNGICVDAHLRTCDEAISAIGDAVAFPSVHAGGRARLESVQNAVDQARAVAARLMGKTAPYSALPWFWSDQGDLKLQIAGLSQGHDRTVVVGQVSEREMTTLCFGGDRLLAVETTNRPADHLVARKLLAVSAALTPDMACQTGFNFKAWAEASWRKMF